MLSMNYLGRTVGRRKKKKEAVVFIVDWETLPSRSCVLETERAFVGRTEEVVSVL